jgi:predicted HTH transcriptional regulator
MRLGQQVVGSITEMANLASFATPEVRVLFEEWAKLFEEEILAFIKDNAKATSADIAAKMRLSEESMLYCLSKMFHEGKIMVGEIRVKKGTI